MRATGRTAACGVGELGRLAIASDASAPEAGCYPRRVRHFTDDTPGPEPAEAYESPALIELGTLEELTLEGTGTGTDGSFIGLAPVTIPSI